MAYDRAKRRRALRSGRDRGVRIYVPAAELAKAGIDVTQTGPALFYRVWGSSRGDGGLTVRFYREP